jgi:MoaA/NifB/PqqE/SkfB family radical SAM enzyme
MRPVNKYSDHKILWRTDKLSALLAGEVTPPVHVRLKPTNRCPHDCWYCAYKPEISGMHGNAARDQELPSEKLIEVLEDLRDMGVRAVTFSGGGEPLAHPAIAEALDNALAYGLDVGIITNADTVPEAAWDALLRVKWVRVSADYSSAEEMERSRGADAVSFARVMNNVERLVRERPRNNVGVNYVVTRDNCMRLSAAAFHWKRAGADLIRFSPVWVRDFAEYHRDLWDLALREIAEARVVFGDDAFEVHDSYRSTGLEERREYGRCWWQEVNPVVAADGCVYRCHNTAYTDHGLLGYLDKRRFCDVWGMTATRTAMQGFDPSGACRHQCANDAKNRLIRDTLEAWGDNFV